MKYKGIVLMAIIILLMAWGCGKKGCTDPQAYNYDMAAKKDDGSCLFSLANVGVELQDTINEDINSDMTIGQNTLICGSVKINASVIVTAGVTLVMCAESSISVEQEGSFMAEGTVDNPVYMKGAVTVPGYWRGIRFRSGSSANALIYTEIYHAGGYIAFDNGNIFLSDSARLSIKNSTIGESEKYGISAQSGTSLVDFSKNVFTDNQGPVMFIQPEHIGQLDENSQYKGNNNQGEDAIEVGGNSTSSAQTWPAANVPFLVSGTINIQSDINISPGFKAVFYPEGGISVGVDGSLKAEGTAASPVSFKGKNNKSWKGIRLLSDHPDNKLIYTIIAHGGGHGGYEYANLYLNENASVIIQNSTITGSKNYGIVAKTGTSFPVFSQNTFTDNQGPALSIRSEHMGQLDEDSQYKGNNNKGDDVIEVSGHIVSSDYTWPATDAPFYIQGFTDIQGNLTVNPGFQAVFGSNGAMSISAGGSLKAIGTSTAGITFKGKKESPGYWSGISISGNSPDNEFDYVTVSHAGNYATFGYGNIFIRDGANLTINNSEISYSQNCGIALNGGSSANPADPVNNGNNLFSNNKTDFCN